MPDCQSKKKSWRLRKTVPQPEALEKKKKKKKEEESDEESQIQAEQTYPEIRLRLVRIEKICKKKI